MKNQLNNDYRLSTFDYRLCRSLPGLLSRLVGGFFMQKFSQNLPEKYPGFPSGRWVAALLLFRGLWRLDCVSSYYKETTRNRFTNNTKKIKNLSKKY